MNYPRLIFIDLEGTLLQRAIHLDDMKVAPSAWTLLAERLGNEALHEEQATKDRWLNGGYGSYIEWMEDTIAIHKRYGLTYELFQQVMDSVKEMPGAEVAVRRFHEGGAITAIVTGGFKALADRVQRRFRIYHVFAGCEYFFSPDTGELEHWNLLPADYEGKAIFVRMIRQEYGVSEADCVFVGDGANDIAIAREVGLSIAFNAQPALSDVCTYAITQPKGGEDFLEVARCIDRHVEGVSSHG